MPRLGRTKVSATKKSTPAPVAEPAGHPSHDKAPADFSDLIQFNGPPVETVGQIVEFKAQVRGTP
ncbi:MAG: hypothetical protein ACLP1X_11320 [Polyangiaceae bacterium]